MIWAGQFKNISLTGEHGQNFCISYIISGPLGDWRLIKYNACNQEICVNLLMVDWVYYWVIEIHIKIKNNKNKYT